MLENLSVKQKRIFIIVAIIVGLGIMYFIYNKVGTPSSEIECQLKKVIKLLCILQVL